MQIQPSHMRTNLKIAPEYLVAGMLTRDYIIDSSGKAYNDVPGGSALYAAAAVRLWDGKPGLVASVGEDYPSIWLERIKSSGISIGGVKILPRDMDLRQFMAFSNSCTITNENPVALYARHQLPFPKSLLGYQSSDMQTAGEEMVVLRPSIEESYMSEILHASAAHICALEYRNQLHLTTQLSRYSINTITLNPAPQTMTANHWDEIPALLESITAFFPSERQTISLFQGRSKDILEMATALGNFGCKLIIIRQGNASYLLYDAYSKKKFSIPAYPVKILNPLNTEDALCGGFLAGYRMTYDPLEALLRGIVSASHAAECSDALQMTGVLPGLSNARLEALRPMVQQL